MKLLRKIYLPFALLILLAASSCEEKSQKEEKNPTDEYIAEVKKEYAPDGRVALFDVKTEKQGDSYILKGESNDPEAVESLRQKLEAENIKFTDRIRLLPDAEELEK